MVDLESPQSHACLKKSMNFLKGLILDAIPPGFYAGAIAGAVALAMLGGSAAYAGVFLKRHIKAILLLCAVAVALAEIWRAVK